MDSSKGLEENLDEFQKIIVDLNNISEKMSNENQAVILLNSLPESYREIKAAIKYGQDSFSMDIVKKFPLNKSNEASSSKHKGDSSAANVTDGYDSAEENDGGLVLLGDNGACDVKEIGSIRIETYDDRAGYSYKSDNGVLKVIKGYLVKLKGTLRNGLYLLECTAVSGSVAVAYGKETDKSMLWYNRLAHVPSMGGSRYFMSIIDDFSRKVYMYPLKQKDEAFRKFLELKKQVENNTGKKVKYLRTDNGLEFVNHKFDKFCKSEGIMRHFTITYTPQQNGLAERFNQTIMERTYVS
ncbi:uncharacterized protein LOC120077281 [Benincasa hispida]|uniref:uncharacterized protein LOC120077281 n=1 Tax=Benincasa hispida TaxID=102211 RepID=UPI0018FF5994|nr:uncharacterized protein LOC120077281 [Benincasa hispida]